MTISIDVSEEPDHLWNERLIKSGLGTVYQSKEVSEYFRNRDENPLFLKFLDNGGNIMGQILMRTTSYSPISVKGKLNKKFLGEKKLCQWLYGPIIFNENFKNEIYIELGKYLLTKKYRISASEHPFSPSGIISMKNKFTVTPWATFLIDLKKPKDVLYKNISKHNGRKNIERSIKRNVTIEEMTENSMLEYVELRNQTIKNQNEKIDYENTINWWRSNKPLGYSGFLCRKNGKCVGGLLFSYLCSHIIEAGVARSKIDLEDRLYSQDLIKWKIIEWGHKNNMKYYNLAGFNPNPCNEKEKGILNYKEKWGGEMYYYNLIKK